MVSPIGSQQRFFELERSFVPSKAGQSQSFFRRASSRNTSSVTATDPPADNHKDYRGVRKNQQEPRMDSPSTGSSGETTEELPQFEIPPKLQDFIKRSEKFIETANIAQPTSDNFVKNIIEREEDAEKKEQLCNLIIEQIEGTRILVHPQLEDLIDNFLQIKKKYGTKKEKELYTNTIKTSAQFIKRAIEKRPLFFFGSFDNTLLRNGFPAHPADWANVGTDEEQDIKIEEYMTYDEIQISALIGVSSPTLFINEGGRTNAGKAKRSSSYPMEAVYVGLVGARFERPDKMESQYILVKNDNTSENGYGEHPPESERAALLGMWAKFFNVEYLPTYKEVDRLMEKDDVEAKEIFFQTRSVYVDIQIYKLRMRISIEIFLSDANDRAEKKGKKAFCHVVGLGLGVWQIVPKQATWFLDVFWDVLKKQSYPHIANINFSWFPPDSYYDSEEDANNNGIEISFSKRNPADKLEPQHREKLLVAMYAWDGNSYPGNEYWGKMLAASGDPAAACCSTIPELQNPSINFEFLDRQFHTSGTVSKEEPRRKLPVPPESDTISASEDSTDPGDLPLPDSPTLTPPGSPRADVSPEKPDEPLVGSQDKELMEVEILSPKEPADPDTNKSIEILDSSDSSAEPSLPGSEKNEPIEILDSPKNPTDPLASSDKGPTQVQNPPHDKMDEEPSIDNDPATRPPPDSPTKGNEMDEDPTPN